MVAKLQPSELGRRSLDAIGLNDSREQPSASAARTKVRGLSD